MKISIWRCHFQARASLPSGQVTCGAQCSDSTTRTWTQGLCRRSTTPLRGLPSLLSGNLHASIQQDRTAQGQQSQAVVRNQLEIIRFVRALQCELSTLAWKESPHWQNPKHTDTPLGRCSQLTPLLQCQNLDHVTARTRGRRIVLYTCLKRVSVCMS